MSAVAVDTSVLLANGEPASERWQKCLLSFAGESWVSSVVLAEVRSFFSSDRACLSALRDLDLHHSPLSEEAAILAGRIYREYRRSGGPRTTILPDFLVAAHAATQADALATEDRGYFRSYFPGIRVVSPKDG